MRLGLVLIYEVNVWFQSFKESKNLVPWLFTYSLLLASIYVRVQQGLLASIVQNIYQLLLYTNCCYQISFDHLLLVWSYYHHTMAASNDQTSKKYMVLKPDEASLIGLIRFLISGNIESKQFIECLRVKKTSLKHRVYIFFSIFIQNVLQFAAKPLSVFGSIFELWLNLLACNGNFCLFLLNLLRG